jgi:hypothetical protein
MKGLTERCILAANDTNVLNVELLKPQDVFGIPFSHDE